MGVVGTQKSNGGLIMKKELTITDVENRIEFLECLLSRPLPMKQWAHYIGQYHALIIKLAHMKGERVSASYSKSDYII